MEQDKRFTHIKTDPKFRRIPKGERKVKIDKRFQSMFKDKHFKIKYTTDKRGRPVNHTSTEDLKRYYHLSSEESSSSDEDVSDSEDGSIKNGSIEGRRETKTDINPGKLKTKEISKLKVKSKHDREIPITVKNRLKNLSVDYARGESALFSESSSDEEESDTESEEEAVNHAWGELDHDAETTEESTHRLAACNMDWDRIRATDLMVLLSSFLSPGSVIHSVTIYPSEFGLKRLAEEESKGPIELVEANQEEGDDNEEGSRYHMEKLRQYQLNRLKYYYAVIVCDSVNTANKLYTECDGLEYESSATKMDLRFIPDDVVFDQEPKEVCEKLPEQGKYQPRFFTTTALQQAKVDLTWDETNPERREITQKLASGKVDEVAEADIQAYLASSSGEESGYEDDDEHEVLEDMKNPIDKYKALLDDINAQEQKKNERDIEMQISWGVNLTEKTDKLMKEKLAGNEEKTPFEKYLEKRKEKRKLKKEEHQKNVRDESDHSDVPSDIDLNDPYFAEEFNTAEFKQKSKKTQPKQKKLDEDDEQRKAELELLLLNENEDAKKHFSLKEIQERENESKTKRKRQKHKKYDNCNKNDFNIDVADERFSALYSSHHFNIDPTDPHYKKTKAMEALISEKLKRRNLESEDASQKKCKTDIKVKDAELSVLVKSVKRKTKALVKKK